MPDYRRYRLPSGAYFFTVNLLQRYPNDLLVSHNYTIRTVARAVRQKRPFVIDYRVVLPDHLHCAWTLPPGDDDFTNRWQLIKQDFSKSLPVTERRSAVRMARGGRASAGSGSAVFGYTPYATMPIMTRILIIVISIRLNTAM